MDNIIRFKKWDCVINLCWYGNGRLAMRLNDAVTGAPVAVASVNVADDIPIGEKEMAIKDYAENDGIQKVLIDAGVIQPTGRFIPLSQWVTVEVCELLEVADVFIQNDGGRAESGYKGDTRDCAVRAIAIATQQSYKAVYDDINEAAKFERPRKGGVRSNARTGVHSRTVKKYMNSIGWEWVPTMFIGSGCKVHVKTDELPAGRLVLNLSKHYAAFINGSLHDTYDCSRDGTRCVYGYFHKGEHA